MGNTFHFVGMRPAAGTAGVGNGRPSLQTWIAHSEISVVPVPPAGSGDHRSRVGDERIAGRVEQSLQCFAKFWRSRILKRAKLWARVADDIRPLKEPATIGRALTEEDRQRLLKAAVMHPEGETAHLAAILCLNTTARGCELKALQWSDVDLFARTLTIRTSKTAAGERVVPLRCAVSALAQLRRRAESFGPAEPSHYIFAAFVPKFTFSGKKVIDYKITAFAPTTHLKNWRSAGSTLTKKAGLPGFRFHDLRHCAITRLAEGGTSDSTIMAIAGHVSRRMLERYCHVRMEAKRNAMETLAASTRTAGYDTSHDTNVVAASTRPI